MKTRQILRDIVSVMIIALGIFVIASGFVWSLLTGYARGVAFNWSYDKSFSSLGVLDALFLLFQLISLLASVAISFCRLFRVQFKENKTERVVAIVYLCLAFLSIHPLLLFTAFTAWTFYADDPKWYILAVSTSVYFLDFCILWLSVQSAKLLVRTRRQTYVESDYKEGQQ